MNNNNELSQEHKQIFFEQAQRIEELTKENFDLQKKNNELLLELKELKELTVSVDLINNLNLIQTLTLLCDIQVITITKLAENLKVSLPTMRRYLEIFSNQGFLMYNRGAMPVVKEKGKKLVELFKKVKPEVSKIIFD